MFKCLICGGRHFTNYSLLEIVMDQVISKLTLDLDVEIVSGHAEGADKLGERYAKENDYALKIFPAAWSTYGRAAGPIRNKQMIDYLKESPLNSCAVIGFASPQSKGTKYTLELAKKARIPVFEIAYSEKEEVFENLTEGIKFIDNEIRFDWNNDEIDDVMKITQTHINLGKYLNNSFYYGYRVNKHESKDARDKTLRYLKYTDDENIKEMIRKSLEMFFNENPVKHFDDIIVFPSSSKINQCIADEIKKDFDKSAQVVLTSKLPSSALEIDYDKVNNQVKYEDKKDFIDYLIKIKNYVQEDSYFKISKIRPQFRRFFKSMLKVEDEKLTNTPQANLLIIDDIVTSGSSLTMLLDYLSRLNYKGTCTIFTLINNR